MRTYAIAGIIFVVVIALGSAVLVAYRAGYLGIGADTAGEQTIDFNQPGVLGGGSFSDVQANNGGLELKEE